MSAISLQGNAGGTGTLTVAAPSTNTNRTLTLPDATGTLIAGTGGITAEANGGTGTTTGYYGFKNRIINGAMVIDQRNSGASQTITAAAALAYTVDRWYGYCTGANVTGQQIAGSGSVQNRYRFTGAASVTAVGFGQRIEQKNSYDLAGSTCTLSADLAISATLTTVTWTAYYATTTADTFGTLASPTVTQIATGTFTVSATVTNFSTNISVPAAATTGIQVVFTVGALTAGLTWTIGNVQLEKGSTATSFDYRPYGTELALCQRYYCTFVVGFRWFAGSSSIPISTIFSYPLTMRAVPTVTQGAGITSANISTASFSTAYSTGAIFQATAATTGDSSRYDNATASAEL